MAKQTMLIELSPEAVTVVEQLMAAYGESSPEGMISRALGFLQLAQRYLGDDGELFVFDPEAAEGRDMVPLVFRNAPKFRSEPLPSH